jgi:hypothetical protein
MFRPFFSDKYALATRSESTKMTAGMNANFFEKVRAEKEFHQDAASHIAASGSSPMHQNGFVRRTVQIPMNCTASVI